MRFLPFIILTEVGMTLFLLYIILYAYDRKNSLTFKNWAITSLLLIMMAGMLDSLSYYLVTDRSFLNTIIAVNISMIMMSGALIALFWMATYNRFSERSHISGSHFSLLLILNEVSMGIFVYALAFDFHVGGGGSAVYASLLTLFSSGINTYLFIIPMALEMSVFSILRPVSGLHRVIFVFLVSTAIISPTITGNEAFSLFGTFGIFSAMTVFIPIIMLGIFRDKETWNEKGSQGILWIFPVLILMMSGVLFGALYDGTFAFRWSLYGFSIVFGMAFYFSYSFRPGIPSKGAGATS